MQKAKEYIEKLEDISYKIDEFIDLTMHGEIRNNTEDIQKELLREEVQYKYIEAEISLERAMAEIENAVECIKEMYKNKM